MKVYIEYDFTLEDLHALSIRFPHMKDVWLATSERDEFLAKVALHRFAEEAIKREIGEAYDNNYRTYGPNWRYLVPPK